MLLKRQNFTINRAFLLLLFVAFVFGGIAFASEPVYADEPAPNKAIADSTAQWASSAKSDRASGLWLT